MSNHQNRYTGIASANMLFQDLSERYYFNEH